MTEQVILVRHGETVHNVAGLAQGWGDSALSDRGRRQVASLAGRLARLQADAIFSSPLQRARSTAEEIARTTGLAVTVLDELREMNYGAWEGQRFLEVRHTDGENYTRWVNDVEFPCPNGESHSDVLKRMRAAIEAVVASSARRPVLVTHGTAIRIATTALLELPLASARNFAQDNAAFNLFVRRDPRWVLKVWNDTSHCAEG